MCVCVCVHVRMYLCMCVRVCLCVHMCNIMCIILCASRASIMVHVRSSSIAYISLPGFVPSLLRASLVAQWVEHQRTKLEITGLGFLGNG